VISERSTCEEPLALYLLSAETGEKRRLTTPLAGSLQGDGYPALSPDGRTVAFVRYDRVTRGDIYALPLSKELAPQGAPRRLASGGGILHGSAWTADGREILFVRVDYATRLWKVPASGTGAPESLAGSAFGTIAISGKGDRLALVRVVEDSNIWRLGLPPPARGAQVEAIPGDRFLRSTQAEINPQYSPDGKQIAFNSDRSGRPSVWVSDADGDHPFELVSVGRYAGTPRWAPDSQTLAFDAEVGGQWDVYTASVKDGRPVQLTNDTRDDVCPSWSRDGRWVYFASRRSGKYQVWKIRAEGGEPVQVTRSGGHVAFESADGKLLYYTKEEMDETSLWKAPADGGPEVEVLPSVWARNFFVVARGIYFITPPTPDRRYFLRFLDLASGKVKTIAPAQPEPYIGLTVSPDERTLLYTVSEMASSDLVLVENFR